MESSDGHVLWWYGEGSGEAISIVTEEDLKHFKLEDVVNKKKC